MYRVAIVDADDDELDSAQKISNMVSKINGMYTPVNTGVTGVNDSGTQLINLTIDEDQIVPENVKNNWKYAVPTIYYTSMTKTDLYLDMKDASNYPNVEKSGSGTTTNTFSYNSASYWAILFLDENFKVIGYAPMGNIE
ncbi:hypothetical protein AB9L15_08315 [Lysinibacillus fusiformis]|uniref:hypothetical protein n=1 Tax=Lysinibacillus fusiformis TaxID=28031 RepID=UPI0000F3627B|nr:hypothetical protein BB14905_13475 [Bacillus sp. B14905]